MYDEIKIQRNTIKDLERQIQTQKATSKSPNQPHSRIEKEHLSNKRVGERCVSVTQMGERSSSPMINIPRLDLSKVLPYEKTHKSKTLV